MLRVVLLLAAVVSAGAFADTYDLQNQVKGDFELLGSLCFPAVQ